MHDRHLFTAFDLIRFDPGLVARLKKHLRSESLPVPETQQPANREMGVLAQMGYDNYWP